MGKVSVIELTLAKTFREIKKKVEGDNVKISETSTPSIGVGKAVFREELPYHSRLRRLLFPFQMLPSTPRNMAIHLEGTGACFEINEKELESHVKDIWSDKEKEKFVDKVVSKSKASQQIISSGRFYVLVGLLLTAIVLPIVMRGGLR